MTLKERIYRRAFLAALRWTVDDTANIVKGRSPSRPDFDESFLADLQEMREAWLAHIEQQDA